MRNVRDDLDVLRHSAKDVLSAAVREAPARGAVTRVGQAWSSAGVRYSIPYCWAMSDVVSQPQVRAFGHRHWIIETRVTLTLPRTTVTVKLDDSARQGILDGVQSTHGRQRFAYRPWSVVNLMDHIHVEPFGGAGRWLPRHRRTWSCANGSSRCSRRKRNRRPRRSRIALRQRRLTAPSDPAAISHRHHSPIGLSPDCEATVWASARLGAVTGSRGGARSPQWRCRRAQRWRPSA